MTDIIIYGNDREIHAALKSGLEKYCRAGVEKDNIIVSFHSDPSETIPDNSIIVISNKYRGKIKGASFIAIFFSSNNHAACELSKSGNIAISCGTSPKDTISAASIDSGKILVSLQRTIRGINDEIIEPHDFYIKSGCSLYPALAACAVLLLLGITPEESFEF